MKRKRKFSTGEGVYEGDGYAGVENGMGGGAGYQGEGEYGPDVSAPEVGSEYGVPGPSTGVYGGSVQYQGETLPGGAQRTGIGQALDKLGELSPSQQRALSALPGGAVISGLLSLADKTGAGWTGGNNTRGRGSSGDPGENGDRRPGDTASDVKPFGSDAPTGTTKMEDEQGTGEKKYRWDPKLRQYVLENLGAGANPMGYRQGQVFQMAQGGQVPRSFAAGGAVTPLDAATKAAIVAEAQRRATAAGTTPEAELYKYAQSQGLSNEDLDTYMGFGAGSSASWVQQNAGKYGVAAASGNSYVTPAPAPAPSPAPTGIAAGAGTAATPAAGGGITALNPTDRASVVAEAERRGALSGKDPRQELYNYATGLGYTAADIDTWMGFPAGTSALWASQNIGGNMVVTPTPGPAPGPAPGPSPDPTVDRTPAPGPTPAPAPTPAPTPTPDPYGGLTALDPTNRAAAVAEAQRLAGISGRTPERELYNFATQKSGLNNGQIDRVMGFENGTTDAWWAQQAGGGRDALANGGGGYGGGGSNFNNGGLDGLGIRNADGTRTMLGGVNDNAQDSRQYGWRTGLQAAAPAQQGPYIRGMAAGGIAAGAPAPRFVSGGGTGLSDEVPVTMDDGGAGRLADGEFVITADVVSGLGGGSSKAGAKMLYDMMERVRQQAHGSKKQIRPVDPKQVLPA